MRVPNLDAKRKHISVYRLPGGNFLDNALRHTPAQSVVHVVLRKTSGGYAIAVSDAGRGIPPENQAHIFERFYRVDACACLDSHGGAGLGLALARWIANVHGGDVALTRSSASGSTFTASLPQPG